MIAENQYDAWIAAFIASRNGILNGACSHATEAMVAAFPELRRVAGFCQGREHFWCVSAGGTIVDPTAIQFHRRAAIDDYVEWHPGDEVRMGTCMCCGEPIYGRPTTLGGDDPELRSTSECSDSCGAELRAYYQMARAK